MPPYSMTLSVFNDTFDLDEGTCETWYPQGNRVGGSWCSLDVIEAFIDPTCTETVQATITKNGGEGGFCTPLNELGPPLGCEDGGEVGNPCFWAGFVGYKTKKKGGH